MFALQAGNGPCRTYVIPICDPAVDFTPNTPLGAAATFTIPQRDALDYSIDASIWLGANGNALLTNAVWAVASGSPKTPTLSTSVYSQQGKSTVVVTNANGALPGDAYWLDVTLSVGATTPANPGGIAIPARTLVRRIYIIVTAG